jgi:uncharacterized membrane protein
MPLRSARERIIQTISFEIGGVLIAAPLYALLFGADAAESLGLMVALSVAVMVWAGLHNTAFDWLDWRLTGRLASDRRHRWRVVHALSQEVTSVLVTTPLIMVVGGFGFWPALALDIGLTLFYAGYAYLFHLAFDWLRPVRPPA